MAQQLHLLRNMCIYAAFFQFARINIERDFPAFLHVHFESN